MPAMIFAREGKRLIVLDGSHAGAWERSKTPRSAGITRTCEETRDFSSALEGDKMPLFFLSKLSLWQLFRVIICIDNRKFFDYLYKSGQAA